MAVEAVEGGRALRGGLGVRPGAQSPRHRVRRAPSPVRPG